MIFFETISFLSGLIIVATQYSDPDWEDDARLVDRLKKGEREAFAALVSKYQKDIYNIAYFKLWNPSEAEEAAQEAFVRSLAAINTLRESKKYYGFLKTITLNCCNDMISHKVREGEPLPESESAAPGTLPDSQPGSPEDITGQREMIGLVRHAMDNLNQEEKEIVVLKHFQELTFREISGRLGIPENTAKTIFYRTLEKLGQTLRPVKYW
jgi:RNA polymerase sigma-70 factor, ECF subfamily